MPLRVLERRQITMVVQCPDDLVPAQHSVRIGEALVETLDLTCFSEPSKVRDGVVGRDATEPRLSVGLWLHACIRGIGWARELARRCEESASLRWLCGGVRVNDRLLSAMSRRQRRLPWKSGPRAPHRIDGSSYDQLRHQNLGCWYEI